MKKALVSGVTGQFGSYMADLLLTKGYEVVGFRRRSASGSLWRLESAFQNPNFKLVEADLCDFTSIFSLLNSVRPDEVYNFAAQSHVHTSFGQPTHTFQVNTLGVLNLLESIKLLGLKTKFYQASTSEMFGDSFEKRLVGFSRGDFKDLDNFSVERFQDETTKFNPLSPYAISKMAAHQLVNLYRDAYGLWAVAGLMFNSESPRRNINFVTRKITSYFRCRNRGTIGEKLKLGNIEAFRDWNYTPEAVEAIWLIMQQEVPKTYVVGTGETHSIKEFLKAVMNICTKYYEIEDLVEIDENLKRPAEVPFLCANPALIKKELGWEAKTKFKDLVEIMVQWENGKE